MESDKDIVTRMLRLRSAMLKDTYVLTMAMSTPKRPGAFKRAVNAARRLDAIIKEQAHG